VSAIEPMANADAAWLHMDQPTNLMVITGLIWFDERPDWERVREVVRTRLIARYPRFRQRVVEGRPPFSGPHWEDDPRFDPALHFHRVALPPPGDEARLRALVVDVAAAPLDQSKPLWHFHLVDGFGEGAAIIVRIHHCIADGIALARVLLSLTDEPPEEPPPEEAAAEAGPGRLEGLVAPARGALAAAIGGTGSVVHESVEVARDPSRLLDLAAAAREDLGALAKLMTLSDDPPSPLKGEMGVAKAVTWTAPIPLEEVREMGHATGTTVNDIVLAAVTGAFRRYLRGRGSRVDELTAIVPFNLRPPTTPLPRRLGNRFGLVYARLPIGIGDRRRRLHEIHDRMDEIKRSPEGAVSYGVLDAIGRTPVGVEERLIDVFSAKGSSVITNVPGPPRPVRLAGTEVAGSLAWAPASGGVSMTISIFSYAGRITVGLLADATLVPDPERISDAIESEIDALLRLKRP